MKKKILAVAVILLLLGFLLLNPEEALKGSQSGLLLWAQSVLPVLLPFFILSRLLISLDGLTPLTRILSPVTRRLWGLSPMGSYALLLGFLCGYPMGAKVTRDLILDQKISAQEGQYLLLFCNNVSPAFLLGFCMNEHLKAPQLIPLTLGLVYGLPLLLALFWRRGRRFEPVIQTNFFKGKQKQASGFQISFKIVDACIMDGLESILKLGCYILLFSIMARFAALLPWPNSLYCGIAIGALEITNGVSAVCQLNLPLGIRYLTVLGFVIFGGCSGIAQTDSMLSGSGLSIKSYVKAKLITALLAVFLAFLLTLLRCRLLPV